MVGGLVVLAVEELQQRLNGSHTIPELVPDWDIAEFISNCKDLSFDTKLGWY